MQHAKPRVLVVDDHPANRLAFEVVLEKDYDVHVVESGRQALDLANSEEFAVILLDVRMPLMDGFETATRLRQLPLARDTVIIFTSAIEKSQAHVYQGFNAGATDYLFSPIEPELLKFKVGIYAHMHARNHALRFQIAQLNDVVSALRAETKTVEGSSAARIRQLEEVIEELKQQMEAPVIPS